MSIKDKVKIKRDFMDLWIENFRSIAFEAYSVALHHQAKESRQYLKENGRESEVKSFPNASKWVSIKKVNPKLFNTMNWHVYFSRIPKSNPKPMFPWVVGAEIFALMYCCKKSESVRKEIFDLFEYRLESIFNELGICHYYVNCVSDRTLERYQKLQSELLANSFDKYLRQNKYFFEKLDGPGNKKDDVPKEKLKNKPSKIMFKNKVIKNSIAYKLINCCDFDSPSIKSSFMFSF